MLTCWRHPPSWPPTWSALCPLLSCRMRRVTSPTAGCPVQVCGLFMQSTDSEARKRDHIEGKQYQGTSCILLLCVACTLAALC